MVALLAGGTTKGRLEEASYSSQRGGDVDEERLSWQGKLEEVSHGAMVSGFQGWRSMRRHGGRAHSHVNDGKGDD
jgi:hypothetical protein